MSDRKVIPAQSRRSQQSPDRVAPVAGSSRVASRFPNSSSLRARARKTGSGPRGLQSGGPQAPMRWAGANHSGDPVFGVAASMTEIGSVDITAFSVSGGSPVNQSLHRSLTTYEARRLAEYLAAAADEADRREALQLVATA